ncbi:hypothetical protein SDC9_172716 [bioreactor metagenome]|uniref:Uncharacterized protein n=1 Tax=bioreactor metagenome TaxID=1076179 RepID=A0A645GEI5_9ZZZZ
MLHHDDGVAVGGDAVGPAGPGEAGLGVVIVADAGGVHVAEGVDLRAADKGDEPVFTMKPLVGLKADEADVGPLHGAVGHKAVVAHAAGHLHGVAVHQAALHDGVAGGADNPLGQRCADQRQTRSHNDNLVRLNVFGDGEGLHFLLGIICIIRHFQHVLSGIFPA